MQEKGGRDESCKLQSTLHAALAKCSFPSDKSNSSTGERLEQHQLTEAGIYLFFSLRLKIPAPLASYTQNFNLRREPADSIEYLNSAFVEFGYSMKTNFTSNRRSFPAQG